MGQIVEFAKPEQSDPHGQGEAVCMACSHEWQAVAPVGVTEFECPQCHTHKGRYKFNFTPPENCVWECHCGNRLFNITPDGTFCPNCGVYQNF